MENNNTQSAVEWLDGVLDSILDLTPSQFSRVKQAFEQAKQMEEQRIQQELEKLKDFDDWKEWKTKNRF